MTEQMTDDEWAAEALTFEHDTKVSERERGENLDESSTF